MQPRKCGSNNQFNLRSCLFFNVCCRIKTYFFGVSTYFPPQPFLVGSKHEQNENTWSLGRALPVFIKSCSASRGSLLLLHQEATSWSVPLGSEDRHLRPIRRCKSNQLSSTTSTTSTCLLSLCALWIWMPLHQVAQLMVQTLNWLFLLVNLVFVAAMISLHLIFF